MFYIFQKFPEIIADVSTKKDGTMKITGIISHDERIKRNRQKFFRKFGVKDKLIVNAGLSHSNKVKIVSKSDTGNTIENTDSLITDNDNLFLTITIADCLPVFIFDWEKGVIGLAHAGWRGLAKNILPATVRKMVDRFKSSPKNILIGIGPGIYKCHFEVKEDLLEVFKNYLSKTLLIKRGKYFLDLKEIARLQLINEGIEEKNIEVSRECTFCLSDKYFSFRRDKILKTMVAFIGKKKL